MIQSDNEYTMAVGYVSRLQQVLFDLRRSHTPTQYHGMCKAYLRELTRVQREIARFLASSRETDCGR